MVSTTVHTAKQDFQTQLETLDSIALSRKRLNLKIGLTRATANIEAALSSSVVSDDVTVLDRIVGEFSFHLIHLKELGLESAVAQDNRITKTAEKLRELVSVAFLKAVKTNDEDSTVRCLRMFVSLDAVGEAERRVKEEIVRVRLSEIFSQRRLEDSTEDLKGLFQEALRVLDEDLKPLLDAIKG